MRSEVETTESHPTLRRSATVLGLLAILFWSLTVGVSRSAAEKVGPLTCGSLAFLIGGVVGSVVTLARRGKRGWPDRRYLIGCGLLFILYQASLYVSLGLARDRTQALEVGLLNYQWPMLTILLSIPILGMRGNALLVPGVIVGALGVALSILGGSPGAELSAGAFLRALKDSPAPYALGLTAGVTWALYSTLSRRWGGKGGATPLFMLASGLVLGAARLVCPEPANWSVTAVVEVLVLASAPMLAYVFWDFAMRCGDIVLVAACSYATPLLATLFACAYLGVAPGARLVVACACVIAGAVFCKLSVRERREGK